MSVMLGKKKSGVAQVLLKRYLNLIVWYFINHRLESSLCDAINRVGVVNHFQIFWESFILYGKSQKNGLSKKLLSTEFTLNLATMYNITRIPPKPGNNCVLCIHTYKEKYLYLRV